MDTLALYHFDEANSGGGKGTTVYDARGNGHHATTHGSVKWVLVEGNDKSTAEDAGNAEEEKE